MGQDEEGTDLCSQEEGSEKAQRHGFIPFSCLHFSASCSLITGTFLGSCRYLSVPSFHEREGTQYRAPVSTLILFKGKIKNSKTSGLLMPAKRVLSEPPVSIRVPGAWLVIVFPSKIVISVSLMSIFP